MTLEDIEKLRAYIEKHQTYIFKEPKKAYVLDKKIVKEKKDKKVIFVEKVARIPCLLKWASKSFSPDVKIYPGIIFFVDVGGEIFVKGEEKIAF